MYEQHKARRPNPTDLHVGSRLRLIRSTRKQSQETVGRVLGVTFQQIQKYERGANRIGAGRLWDIAQHFKLEVNWFFEGLDDEREIKMAEHDASAITLANSELGIKMAAALANIRDVQQRKSLLEMARSMGWNN